MTKSNAEILTLVASASEYCCFDDETPEQALARWAERKRGNGVDEADLLLVQQIVLATYRDGEPISNDDPNAARIKQIVEEMYDYEVGEVKNGCFHICWINWRGRDAWDENRYAERCRLLAKLAVWPATEIERAAIEAFILADDGKDVDVGSMNDLPFQKAVG